MPKLCCENGNAKGSLPKESQIEHAVDTNNSARDAEATSSPRPSEESDVPWPFDSESSVNEEETMLGGECPYSMKLQPSEAIIGVRVETWRTRLRRAFHMRSGYRDGYGDDVRIKPLIESCKIIPLERGLDVDELIQKPQ